MRCNIRLASRLIAASVLLLSALASPAMAQEGADQRTSSPPAITVLRVQEHVLRERVIAAGLVAPIEIVEVVPLIEGQPIEALFVDVGDKVVQGQTLAKLSDELLLLEERQLYASRATAAATIAQAEAQVIEAQVVRTDTERARERAKTLRAQGAISQASLDTAAGNADVAGARVMVAAQSLEAARAQLSLADAQIANMALQLERSEVKATVGGTIMARNAVLGIIASGAQPPMFSILRDNALEVRADVSEIDLLRLSPGQKARLSLVGVPHIITGTVRLVEPTIDIISRLGRARIEIDSPQEVRSGMFAEVEILVSQRGRIAVPLTAVNGSADAAFVWRVADDGRVSRQAVTTGIRDGGWVEIISQLEIGDVIVAKSGAFVRQDEEITPILGEAPAID